MFSLIFTINLLNIFFDVPILDFKQNDQTRNEFISQWSILCAFIFICVFVLSCLEVNCLLQSKTLRVVPGRKLDQIGTLGKKIST